MSFLAKRSGGRITECDEGKRSERILMSNWIDFQLDVLAGSPAEINVIEAGLQEPCGGLLTWVAGRWNDTPDAIAADLKALVCFKPTENLERTNRGRRFTNLFKSYSWGIVMSHICFV